jgi:hypothetical protein
MVIPGIPACLGGLRAESTHFDCVFARSNVGHSVGFARSVLLFGVTSGIAEWL